MANPIIIEESNSVLDFPQPTKETRPRQRSFDIADLYLTRFVPPWSRPPSLPAYVWRMWVLNQSVATDAKEFLVSKILNLDWKITPRNSNYREELQPTIKYYTDLFTNGGKYDELGLDWSGLIEWCVGDLLDLPFGTAIELGRKNDSPDGRVMWMRPLDGGTLYPTLNKDFPVFQYANGFDGVSFPQHAVVRSFLSPIQNIWREGWGMPPPEKIYLAMEMLNRGDKYYGNLLLDIPPLGVFDLGDIDQPSAVEFRDSFNSLLGNQTVAFKVPLLYEHNNKVEFIPLSQRPDQIMYDKITHKYASLVCAAYGITPADINLSTTTASGETLAGAIRSERHSKSTGEARIKAKVKYLFNRILPPSLEFSFIDYDTEEMVNRGRARLADASAYNLLQMNGVVSRQEIRSQTIQDGLFTISIPDELPPEAKEKPQTSAFGGGAASQVGTPKNPSQGGEGDVKKKSIDSVSFKLKSKLINDMVSQVVAYATPQIVDSLYSRQEDELIIQRSLVDENIFSNTFSLPEMEKPLVAFELDEAQLISELKEFFGGENIVVSPSLDDFVNSLKSQVNGYLAKVATYTLADVIFAEKVFDYDTEETYNYLRNSVNENISKSLTEYVKSFIQIEMEKLIQKIKIQN